ncbi:hypothetical protein ACHAQJ_006697 [Trichoderma viride]
MWLPAALGLELGLLCLSAAVTEALSQFERLQLNSRPCPRSCDDSRNPNEWSFYHDIRELAVCNEPLLLDYNLLTSFDDPNTDITIRTCTLGNATSTINYLQDSGYVDPNALGETNFGPGRRRRDVPSNATCGAGPASKSSVTAYLTQWNTSETPLGNQTDAVVAAKSLKEYLRGDSDVCKKKILFSYFHGTLVGVYSGSLIDTGKTSEAILQQMIEELEGDASITRKAFEMCTQECTSSSLFGVVADASGDFAAVQAIMKSWNEGKRVAKITNAHTTAVDKAAVWSFNNVTASILGRNVKYIGPRAECRSIRVASGDTCTTLATRCGIGATAFSQFNKGTKDLCTTLTPGQPVCCSSGTLPDIDGSCAFHVVELDEGCQFIASSNGLTIDELLDFNTKTWGWTGCKNLQVGLRVCVSTGRPPMPASVYNAVCGPTVSGTDPPGDNEELADLNPCPLDVCCNIWGQCGTTKDFCIKSESETGNPGTSKPGENGCISNCGMEVVNNDEPPAQYRKIGYFEGWNYNRSCLNMEVLDIDNSYTHVHFAFGVISSDLQVVIKDENQEQWNLFLGAGGDFKPKKILSFGGWDFSNGPETSGLFRKAVAPGSRETFANRVVAFANENNLDGVDFDWEYPGATDIDGSEPGEEMDGENYLEFLKLVREKLPNQRSLSAAVPASYWYLRGFPIKKMAPVLDYIVVMAYDLHGQWDVGRKWAMDGCPAGSCLRSHINSTETHESLVMVTKAGVVSHKIVVGITSYGRSFKMSDATCRGPQWDRNNSPAQKGRCTDTSGYISNFEILEIIKKGGAIKSWYDSETDSDYLVYNKTEWVAYMTEETKSRRIEDYKKINFGGTSDWALDLQGEGTGNRSSGRPVYLDPIVYQSPIAKCDPPCILVFPPSTLPSSTTITINKYTTSLEYGAVGKATVDGKEVTKFLTTTTTITISVPPITTDKISYSNINITKGQDSTELSVQPSVRVPPIPFGIPDGEGKTTTRTLTLPPWPAITSRTTSGATQTNLPDDTTTRAPHSGETSEDLPPDTTQNPDTTTNELPTWTTWPPGIITPIGEYNENDPDDNGHDIKTPCKLWFFFLCISRKDFKIQGLRWTLPPGIYPPGPPPPNIIRLPGAGWTIKPPLPPWPPITIGRDNKMTYDEEPSCKTESASICSTTTYLSQTIVGPVTSTITSTASDCEAIYGCSLKDWESATTVTSEACALPTGDSKRDADDDSHYVNLAASDCAAPAIVYPRDSENVGEIPVLLDQYKGKYVEIGAPSFNYIAFYWIPMLDKDTLDTLLKSPDVADAYYYEEWNAKVGGNDFDYEDFLDNSLSDTDYTLDYVPTQDDGLEVANDTLTDRNWVPRPQLEKRAPKTRATDFWPGSQVSLPPGKKWKATDSDSYDSSNTEAPYKFHWDNNPTQEQFVYVSAEAGLWTEHVDNIEYLRPPVEFGPEDGAVDPPNFDHGSRVSAMIMGEKLGVCEKCKIVMITTNRPIKLLELDEERYPREKGLQNLLAALEHIKKNRREGRATINMSYSYMVQHMRPAFLVKLQEILNRLVSEVKAVLVVAAGNHASEKADGRPISRYPALLANPGRMGGYIPSLIVVGATDDKTEQTEFSQYADFLTTYAPGQDLPVPKWSTIMDEYTIGDGTSYAAPQVAALAAYFRSLPSPWQEKLREPSNVKKMIQIFHRRFLIEGVSVALETRRPVIWNGQVGEKSCITDFLTKEDWDKDKVCPDIDIDFDKVPDGLGEPVSPCKSDGSATKRQDGGGGYCPILPGDDGALSKTIEWDQGSDSPKCVAGDSCGGRLCTGYYCTSDPKGPPPDFRDPKDPNKGGDKPSITKAPDPTTTTTEKPAESTKVEDPPPDNYCINMYVRSKTFSGGGGPLRFLGTGGTTTWDIWLEYNGQKVCEDKPECLDCKEQEVKCNDGFSMKVIVSDKPGEYTDVVISFPGNEDKTVRLENNYFEDNCFFGTNPSHCPEYKYEGSDGGCR